MGLIRNIFLSVKAELFGYSKSQRSFILFAMLCGFFICFEYSIIRPVSNALLIEAYGAKTFPYVWLATIPLNLLFVSLYNRLLPIWGSKRLFVSLIGTVVGMNILFAFFSQSFPSLAFGFAVWKEVYILLMFQLVWSVIHANMKFSKAKYLYGIFFGLGGLGSMIGSFFPSFFAVSYGSENLIYLTLPVYAILLFVYWKMSHYCEGDAPQKNREERGGFFHGIRLIKSSRFLIFALLSVAFMQMVTATVDFQFNDFLERAIEGKDLRTQYGARVMGLVYIFAILMQFLGTYLVLHWVGLKKAHYFVPLVLATGAALVLFSPVFAFVSLSFIACKALDFSIFGAIKEMLYIPLTPDEKFRAKAVIDVFAYRTCKAFASLLIIFVTAFLPSTSLSWFVLFLAFCWVLSITYGLKEFEKFSEGRV